MARIRILDSSVANQIAAGEVVERPASVVKELLENALDAGASTIEIRVARAGAEEIRVLDDGEGMDREDALLALQRHATSKISRLDQLSSLATLGFRGEALPAIASVSRLTLESSPDPSGEGTRIRVEGGRAISSEVVGHPRGTTVIVRSLFYNAPARRKFLRSPLTEMGRITDIVSRTAVAHFDRRFTLATEEASIRELPPGADRWDRVRQIFGRDPAAHLLPFSRNAGPLRAHGFASRPDFTRAHPRDQWLFVNGRPIRDRAILHALSAAYHTLLPRGRFPFVLLFLEVPPERMDINVHPAKWEVRLADPGSIHELVRLAVRGALEGERPVAAISGFAAPAPGPPPTRSAGLPRFDRISQECGRMTEAVPESSARGGPPVTSLFEPRGGGLGTLVPLAQYRESYILAADEEGLVVVDQHVAHERVLYERLLRESEGSRVRRQALLFPIAVELNEEKASRLAARREELEGLGFVLEPFGGRTLLVREVPTLLGSADVSSLLEDVADDLRDGERLASLERFRDRLAATTACHAAVKVNHPLTLEKMSFLLEELSRTASPMTCPHGRPVLLRLSQNELEKNFLRR